MYPPEIRQVILDRIAAGESLRRVCEDEGMPDRLTVSRWLDADKDFCSQYARAVSLRADAKFEELDAIADEAEQTDSPVKIQGLRLKADIIKWQTGKMAPKKYGDKIEHEHTGSFLTELAALNGRANRDAEGDSQVA